MHKRFPVIFALSTLFLVLCGELPNSPLDENSPNFVKPVIAIDTAASSIKSNDTIHFDSATFVLIGNMPQTRFQVKVDSLSWSSWQPSGPFSASSLSDGKHTAYINTMYEGGIKTFNDSIVFFVKVLGYRPQFSSMNDTVISSDTGKAIRFSVSATGSTPLMYQWYKGSLIVAGKTDTIFDVSPFSLKDTGAYFCIASNKYGIDTSRVFRIKIYLPIGGIKGVLVSNKNSAKLSGVVVIMAPGNVKDTSNSEGIFEFNRLHSGTYSVAATLAGYQDYAKTSIEVNDSTIKDLGNIVLTIIDTGTANFKVVYDGNGNTAGTVTIDGNNYKSGMVVTIRGNTGNLVKTGYVFGGWNTVADGSGTAYAAGATFVMGSANVTLYARWTTNPTYTVIYNGNGSTGGTAPADAGAYETGVTVTVKGNTGVLVKTGATFTGWNTAADGSGTAYASGSIFAMGAANVTLYARWTTNPTYTVIYIGNGSTGGTVPVDAGAYETGVTVTVKGNTGNLVKPGSTFTGWNTAADGSGTAYASGSIFAMGAANVTLYARWTTNPTYTVIYIGNGSTGGTVPVDAGAYETGVTVTVKGNTGNLVKPGSTFAGWNTVADGSGTAYAAAATFTMGSAAMTLYAQWTLIPTYSVTYNGNGNTSGTVPADANKYETGATVSVKANTGTLAKTGSTFAGWNSIADGSGTAYAAAATFAMGSVAVTLYAQWLRQTCTVTFEGNGDGATTTTKTVDLSSYVTPLPTSTRLGYVFSGWYPQRDGTGSEFTTSTQVTGNISIYAKWQIKDADGNVYTEVVKGGKTWMVENLKTKVGSAPITDGLQWARLKSAGYCWLENDPVNATAYGALYNWYAVGNLAPSGWHVATAADWSAVSDQSFLPMGGMRILTDFSGKDTTAPYFGTGFVGFYWTTSSASDSTAWGYDVNGSTYSSSESGKRIGGSVRCVRNY